MPSYCPGNSARLVQKFSANLFFTLFFLLLNFVNVDKVLAVPARLDPEAGNENGAIAPEDKEQAAAMISGSPWPGVIDHLLQQPVSEAAVNVHINYPSIGVTKVDADIREWVTSLVETFNSYFEIPNSEAEPDIDEDISKFLQDNDVASHLAMQDTGNAAGELWGNYQVSRPSDNAISITFEIWNYMSNPEGNLDILTLNYNLLTGQRLGLVDIFEQPDVALELMSNWARKKLAPRLGAALRTKMLEDGTAPLAENFSSLTLTPDGLCINFQPYQVAPWNAGIQKVDIPLSELMAAAPLQTLWNK